MMFLLYLDELDELRDSVHGLEFEGSVTHTRSRRSWWHFLPGHYILRRRDFLPEYEGTLDEAARAMYLDQVGHRAPPRVAIMANLASLGWNFNPIALYFFYDQERLVRTIAEVTNTPWGERHLYVLGAPGSMEFEKAHHVSPFLEMEGTYQLTYSSPEQNFNLSMTLFDHEFGSSSSRGPRRFSASLTLVKHELTSGELRRAVLRYPDMALRVSLRIYFQAARLFAKGVKYVAHPEPLKRGSQDVR